MYLKAYATILAFYSSHFYWINMDTPSNKQLLIISAILLFVIAIPVIINASDYVTRSSENWAVSNKEKYCANEYPAHTIKALTPSEFDVFIENEISNISTTDTYNFFMIGEYKNLSNLEAMKHWHKDKLTDIHYNEAVYRGGTRCEGNDGVRYYVGEVIPWYYF